MPPEHGDTVKLVPLGELTALARLGIAMRKAQRAYFTKRKEMPHVSADTEWREARNAERRFDDACTDALARERQQLPGMGGEDD